MNEVKYIYFDVGGVVVLDYSKTDRWNKMLSDLWMNKNQKEIFEVFFREYETRICTWKVTTEDFIKDIQSKTDIKFPKGYSMLEDFVNRFESNTSLVSLLETLSRSFELWLLTNMYPWMLGLIKNHSLLPNVWWKNVVDSSVVWFAKPDRDIFLIAESECWYSSNEILFVENTIKHIDAAKSLGWQTCLYDPSDIKTSNNNLLGILNIHL